MDNENFEMLTLHGSWARERHIQQGPLRYGKQMVSSAKGESSHQEHPFVALVTPETTQQQGKFMECISYIPETLSDRQS